MQRFEDSNVIELYDVPDVVIENCKGGSIIAALASSLQNATGAKPSQYKITFIDENDIRIEVDESIDISEWKPSIDINFLEGNAYFDYVTCKGLVSTTQQNGIIHGTDLPQKLLPAKANSARHSTALISLK